MGIQSVSPTTWPMPLGRRPQVRFFGTGTFPPCEAAFCLPEHWTLHVCHYAGSVTVDGIEYELQPGRASLMAPGTQKLWRFVQDSYHTCAHFRFEASEHASQTEMPALVDLGQAFGEVNRDMEEAIAYYPDNPLRAEVRLWDILHRLSDAQPFHTTDKPADHPSVIDARRQIELSLGQPIRIPDLARKCNMSHSQLTRLFQKHCGMTVVAYIRKRRMSRAEHLLRNSTKPIKVIALEIGIGDLQQFNKIVRHYFGLSPRRLREGYSLAPRQTDPASSTDD